jgi:hypothetical protein
MIVIVALIAKAPGARATPVPARDWRGLVLVLSPTVEDELTRDAMVRIVGEFGAALFRVVTREIDPGVDLMTQLETAGGDLAPVAAVAIVRDTEVGSTGAAVWVSNRRTRTTIVQRVHLRADGGDRAAAQLAVETVDLVRASVGGLWSLDGPSGARASDPRGGPDADGGSLAGASSAPARHFRLGIGAAFFGEFDSVPSSWAPVVALSYGPSDRTAFRISLAGLGAGTDVTVADGSGARLQRALLSLGIVRQFRADAWLQPMISASAGVHHLGAQGTGVPADRAHSDSAFSALVSAGGGCSLALGSRLALTAEAEVLLLWPPATIRVGELDVAHLDRPSVFAHAGLLATF